MVLVVMLALAILIDYEFTNDQLPSAVLDVK